MKTKLLKHWVLMYATPLFLMLFACNTSKNLNKDFLYFQRGLDSIATINSKEIVIKSNDLLNIRVTSRTINQEQTYVFNLPGTVSATATGTGTGVGNSNSGYLVGIDGNIEMPMIGSVKAAGLTKLQLQALLTEKISEYVKDPGVLVSLANLNINVLGEVKSPGTQTFQKDKVTIIDAISAASDLTDFGKRDDVTVIREEMGTRKYYKVDLRSGALFQSPAYQLQSNDIVYVAANNRKLRMVNQNPETGRQLGTIVQITTILITLVSIIIRLI